MHSWEPLLAALYSAKVKEATRLCCNRVNKGPTNPKRHRTDSKVLSAVAETEELLMEGTDHQGNDTCAFNLTKKACNRWTALPLPTTETWIRATSEQEPDLVLVKKALETNVTPLRSQLANKKHHTKLVSQRFCLENRMMCRL